MCAGLRDTGLDYVTVRTAEGELRGRRNGDTLALKGVRYAESSAGANRFRPPVPVLPWTGVRDALEVGDPCYQHNPDWKHWREPTDGSEDCLFLNIWTGGLARKKPVMVFFHGGAYFYGSGGAPMYDGGDLAARGDVVVVTVNHRLHAFGFTYLAGLSEEHADCANVGLLDLVEALRWVKRNIAAFGGDPENVTLVGESGGGGKVSCLMAMPSAQGLFHKAIIQSGSQLNVRSPEDATRDTLQLLEILGIPRDRLSDLSSVDTEALWRA